MKWTKEEEDFLRKVYKAMPTEAIAIKLGRNVNCVRSHAEYIGLRKHTHIHWTEEEMQFMKAHYHEFNGPAICAEHLHRNVSYIRAVAFRMGLAIHGRQNHWRWKPEEREYLIANYSTNPTSVIAKHLKRPIKNIIAMANYMGLHKIQELKRHRRTMAQIKEDEVYLK